jgi:hypothetical protein
MWLAIVAAWGFFAFIPTANAGNVLVEISGTLGNVGYGAPNNPLDGGSFSGTVTFASLPAPNTQVSPGSADVNFYNAMGTLIFNVSGGYNTFSAGASGYEILSVGGSTSVGGESVSVSSLVLDFGGDWLFGTNIGTVIPYGSGNPADYNSTLEFTYGTTPTPTTYYNSILMGQASVPEPSTIALSVVGMAGVLFFARRNRRIATA